MLSLLPGYAGVLARQQNPSSVESMGNGMEMAVGLAYTCYKRFANLPPWHRVEFGDGLQEQGIKYWGQLWNVFEILGVKATRREDGPGSASPGAQEAPPVAAEPEQEVDFVTEDADEDPDEHMSAVEEEEEVVDFGCEEEVVDFGTEEGE